MNQNGGIHKGGFAVLCHRNGGSESPGILSLQILVPQALHYSLRLRAVLCQYGSVGMPEAVAVKERVPQLLMEHPGAILERLRRQELSVFAG